MCGLYDDAVVASSTSVSDPTGARRLGHASIGLSVAGIVVSVVAVVIAVALIASAVADAVDAADAADDWCSGYWYNGNCYDYKIDVGTYGYCIGERSGSYCYY